MRWHPTVRDLHRERGLARTGQDRVQPVPLHRHPRRPRARQSTRRQHPPRTNPGRSCVSTEPRGTAGRGISPVAKPGLPPCPTKANPEQTERPSHRTRPVDSSETAGSSRRMATNGVAGFGARCVDVGPHARLRAMPDVARCPLTLSVCNVPPRIVLSFPICKQPARGPTAARGPVLAPRQTAARHLPD